MEKITTPAGVHQIRKTGRWQARIRYTPTPGNHIEKTLGTFDTLDEAVAARQVGENLLAESRIDEYIKPQRQLTNRQQSILTGSMLGDGNLQKRQKPTHNSFFVVKQAKYRREYLEWLFKEFGYLSQGICEGKGQSPSYPDRKTENLRFYTRAQPVFTELRKYWYPLPKDIKIVPPDIELDPLAIAVWFAEDGTNRNKNGRFTFCTNSFTEQDCNILITQLERFGFKAWRDTQEGRIHISQTNKFDFHDLIAPHFPWKCFDYKLNLKDRNAPHPQKSSRINSVL